MFKNLLIYFENFYYQVKYVFFLKDDYSIVIMMNYILIDLEVLNNVSNFFKNMEYIYLYL